MAWRGKSPRWADQAEEAEHPLEGEGEEEAGAAFGTREGMVTERGSHEFITPPAREVRFSEEERAAGARPARREVSDDEIESLLSRLAQDTTLGPVADALARTLDRVKRIERAEIGPPRRNSARFSMLSSSSEDGREDHAKAKLQRPSIFDGGYKEEWCLLNWIKEIERYFKQCRVAHDLYPDYARTYMAKLVQAWLDAQFPKDSPAWSDMTDMMKIRFMPPDHSLKVELKFEKLVQYSSLQDFLEKFQIMAAAMVLAEVKMGEDRMVLQFIRGMRYLEDRRFVLEKNPKTLKDLYGSVNILMQAKTLALIKPSGEEKFKGKDKHSFKKLTGEAREKAWEDGRCLECGSPHHLKRDCPTKKKKGFASGKKEGKKQFKETKGKRPSTPARKGKQMRKLGTSEPSEEADHESDSELHSENSDPESEG